MLRLRFSSLCLLIDKVKFRQRPTAHVRSLWDFFLNWQTTTTLPLCTLPARYLLSLALAHRQVANYSCRLSSYSFSFLAHTSAVSLARAYHWTVRLLSRSHSLSGLLLLSLRGVTLLVVLLALLSHSVAEPLLLTVSLKLKHTLFCGLCFFGRGFGLAAGGAVDVGAAVAFWLSVSLFVSVCISQVEAEEAARARAVHKWQRFYDSFRLLSVYVQTLGT